MTRKDIITESQRWLDLIGAPGLDEGARKRIARETIDNFAWYYNKGFLEYRK